MTAEDRKRYEDAARAFETHTPMPVEGAWAMGSLYRDALLRVPKGTPSAYKVKAADRIVAGILRDCLSRWETL